MKIRDYFKIAILEIKKRNSKDIIYIISVAIAIFLLMFSNMLGNSIKQYEKIIQSYNYMRIIELCYFGNQYTYKEIEEKINELDGIEHITQISRVIENRLDQVTFSEINEEINYEYSNFSVTGVNNKELEAMGLSCKFSSGNAYEIILPTKMEVTIANDATYMIYGKDFVGNEITLSINNKEYTFMVIGTSLLDEIYIPTGTIREIIEEIKQVNLYVDELNIYVDSVSNVEEIRLQLFELILDLEGINYAELGIPLYNLFIGDESGYEEEFEFYKETYAKEIENINNWDTSSFAYELEYVEKYVNIFNIIEICLKILAWLLFFITMFFTM